MRMKAFKRYMKHLFKAISFAFVLALIVWACKKSDNPSVDLGYNYFPTKIGHWVVYDVDCTGFDLFNDTIIYSQYQIREMVESEFIDAEGRLSQRLERYRRDTSTLPWTLTDIWYQTRTPLRAEKIEENVRFVRLIYPVDKGDEWDGNAFNTLPEWEYEYTKANKDGAVGALSFDSTLTVMQINDSNIIELDYAQERYAKNVGLYYKRFVDIRHVASSSSPAISIWNKANDGVFYEFKLNSWGN